MTAIRISATVGTITPARAGFIWSSNSWRFRKYHGALEGLGVLSGFARARNGPLKSVDKRIMLIVIIKAPRNSITTRWGHTCTVPASCSAGVVGRVRAGGVRTLVPFWTLTF